MRMFRSIRWFYCRGGVSRANIIKRLQDQEQGKVLVAIYNDYQ